MKFTFKVIFALVVGTILLALTANPIFGLGGALAVMAIPQRV
jgi:hypothetical protein